MARRAGSQQAKRRHGQQDAAGDRKRRHVGRRNAVQQPCQHLTERQRAHDARDDSGRAGGPSPPHSGSTATAGAPSGTACRRGDRDAATSSRRGTAARTLEPDRLWLERPRPQEVRLVATQVGVIETVGPTLEVASEPLHGVEIAPNGRRREVPALELLQHDAATMGHKTPPVTRTLRRGSSAPHA